MVLEKRKVLAKQKIKKMKKNVYYLLILLIASAQVFAQSEPRKWAFDNYHKYYNPKVNEPEKEQAIEKLRAHYATSTEVDGRIGSVKLSWKECSELIQENGAFKDLIDKERNVASTVAEAYKRLAKIAISVRRGEVTAEVALTPSYLKSIIYYGNLEISRSNYVHRFHDSCFSIPSSAVSIYFSFLKQMDAIESGQNKNPLLKEACDMLKVTALQSWTQPLRKDATDNNVVQIERFRHHVWWVGGNGLGGWSGYRAVMPVAVMYKSVPMIELLAEVAVGGLSNTAQNTNETDFWNEGMTADGAGWGHGRQCLIWGYPIHGSNGIFGILNLLKDTPFNKNIGRENVDALLNFIRGGNFYYYKGYILPCLDRGSMVYDNKTSIISYINIVNNLITNYSKVLTKAELNELTQLKKEAQTKNIQMKDYPAGMYNGTRWFFNNDDLIKKTDDYHLIVNMASSRCSGLESADNTADNYNFYTADGLSLFQRTGYEYKSIFGAYDVTASPGVTAREGMEKLTPVTNWEGYNSLHNFAAAATSGGVNSASGFIFEKNNTYDKKDKSGKALTLTNEVLYGVKANKSWFIVGDYLVALGAGVTNNKPDFAGTIRTTIDQTAWENEITLIQNGKEKSLSGNMGSILVDKNPIWIKQNNKFAYTLLPEFSKKMNYSLETKETDWIKMNLTNKSKADAPKSVKVFKLWLDHGQKPTNDTYGYAVYMGKGNPAAELPVIITNNDTTLQAVQSMDGKVIGAVFYSKNAIMKSGTTTLKVSAPCAVLIEKDSKGYVISVTDAEMNKDLKEIVVTLNGKSISFAMPQGKECGKPISQTVTL